MSIDKSPDGSVTIYLGDEDILMGSIHAKGLVRLWFAPLPSGHGLTFNQPEKRPNTDPPADTAATVFFLNRESLTGFIQLLMLARDISFPPVVVIGPIPKNVSDNS